LFRKIVPTPVADGNATEDGERIATNTAVSRKQDGS
jgi:hypothetical protein